MGTGKAHHGTVGLGECMERDYAQNWSPGKTRQALEKQRESTASCPGSQKEQSEWAGYQGREGAKVFLCIFWETQAAGRMMFSILATNYTA